VFCRVLPWLWQLPFCSSVVLTPQNSGNYLGWRAILSPRSLALARLRMTGEDRLLALARLRMTGEAAQDNSAG
jgi:hypothetical protein